MLERERLVSGRSRDMLEQCWNRLGLSLVIVGTMLEQASHMIGSSVPTLQRRLQGPLRKRKDDTQIREAFHIF